MNLIISKTFCNDYNYDNTSIDCSLTDLIFTNTKIIDKSRHWSLYLELIAINIHKPALNHGTKASKELLISN